LTFYKFRDETDISQNLGTILADAYKFRDEVDDSLVIFWSFEFNLVYYILSHHTKKM